MNNGALEPSDIRNNPYWRPVYLTIEPIISEELVQECLMRYPPYKAPGISSLSADFLRPIVELIVPLLTGMFRTYSMGHLVDTPPCGEKIFQEKKLIKFSIINR